MLNRKQGEWYPIFKVCLPPPHISFSLSLSQGIFLVYDISSERSYQHIMKWVSDVDEVGDAASLSGLGEGTSEGRQSEGQMRKAEALGVGEQTLPGNLAFHRPG